MHELQDDIELRQNHQTMPEWHRLLTCAISTSIACMAGACKQSVSALCCCTSFAARCTVASRCRVVFKSGLASRSQVCSSRRDLLLQSLPLPATCAFGRSAGSSVCMECTMPRWCPMDTTAGYINDILIIIILMMLPPLRGLIVCTVRQCRVLTHSCRHLRLPAGICITSLAHRYRVASLPPGWSPAI